MVSLTPALQRIVDLLQNKGPLSAQEIAAGAFVSVNTLKGGGYLQRLRDLKRIHIAGWAKNHNGFTTALYALGDRKDCVRPKFADEDRDSQGMARIVAVLERRSGIGLAEIARLAGLSRNTVKHARYLNILVEQQRIHIAAWTRGASGHAYPVYHPGPGTNEPKPDEMSRAEISRRYRTKQGRIRSENSFSSYLKNCGLQR